MKDLHQAVSRTRYIYATTINYCLLFSASYTGSSSEEDDVNPRDKHQVIEHPSD